MNAPDKIYVHEVSAVELAEPHKDYHVEYIRKDALLEWLNKTAAEYKKRSNEGELVWQNWCAYNDVIEHLNTM